MRAADLRGVRARMGDAAVDDVSRLDGLRAAAQRAGLRGADDAQHPGALRSRAAGAHTPPRRCTRIIEAKKLAYADMRRHLADPRLSPSRLTQLLSKAYRPRARRLDRSLARAPRGHAGTSPARGSDTTYSARRRSRRQHRVADPEQLRQLRHRHRAGRPRVRAAEPRRPVHARPVASQRAGATQAAAAHDHPRLHAARRRHASRSASWAAGTRRRRTPSSCRTSSITGINIQAALEAPRVHEAHLRRLRRARGSRVPSRCRSKLRPRTRARRARARFPAWSAAARA